MRRSRKSEYRRGVYEGMLNTFFNVTYLSNEENVEARQQIFFKASTLSTKTWNNERGNLQSLDDAYTRGYSVGMDGWDSDEEIDEVCKMAKTSVAAK